MARPTEIAAIVKVLEEPFTVKDKEGNEHPAEPEDYAKAAIKALDALRAQRPHYTVLVHWPGTPGAWFSYAPFPTENKGVEALEKGKIPTAQIPGAQYAVIRTMSPEYAEERAEA